MTDRDIKTIELIINNEQAKKRLEEFKVKFEDLKVKLDKAKKDLVDLREKLGEQLLPVAAKMVNLNKVFMETLSALITWFGKHYKQVIAVTTVIAVYNLTFKELFRCLKY